VNVASHTEPLAEPAGICITCPVCDRVRNKVDFQVDKLRAISLKNVSGSVEVYKVQFTLALGASAGSLVPPQHRRRKPALSTPV
jgi:adenylate cyclase